MTRVPGSPTAAPRFASHASKQLLELTLGPVRGFQAHKDGFLGSTQFCLWFGFLF